MTNLWMCWMQVKSTLWLNELLQEERGRDQDFLWLGRIPRKDHEGPCLVLWPSVHVFFQKQFGHPINLVKVLQIIPSANPFYYFKEEQDMYIFPSYNTRGNATKMAQTWVFCWQQHTNFNYYFLPLDFHNSGCLYQRK